MTELLFVRHGQSQANAEGIIGTADTPLSELGKQQAAATGKLLKEKPITKIVSSPYLRARQTAEIIAREIGHAPEHVELIDELHERGFGEKEGGPKDHETAWYYTVNGEYGIEPHQAVIARMQHAVEKLRTLAKNQNGTILVVGHATAGFYLRQVLKGKHTFAQFDPPDELMNAAIARLVIE